MVKRNIRSLKKQKFKETISTWKNMFGILWQSEKVLLVDFMSWSTTINTAFYCGTLKKLCRAFQHKRYKYYV